MSHQRIISREHLKLIWAKAENAVMNSCFYCKKCEKCDKFYEIYDEFKKKGSRNLNKEVKCGVFIYRGKSKHFKIKPRD